MFHLRCLLQFAKIIRIAADVSITRQHVYFTCNLSDDRVYRVQTVDLQ